MPGHFQFLLRILISIGFVQLALANTSFARTQKDISSVTIPLEDYLNLIKEDKKELRYSSVETVDVTGAYKGDLTISFSGSSSAAPVEVKVMEYNSNYSISSCKGGAALSLEGSNVVLFPQAEKFKLNCSLKVSNWQNLKFNFTKVLAVNMNISGAEAIYEPGGSGEKRFSVFPKDRQVASTNEKPSLVSRYHLSLLKDENRFRYHFQVENPNKKAVDFQFTPRKTEVVKAVHSNLRYDEKEGGYHFVLPPGSSLVTVEGRFTGEQWTAPIETGLSYLLLDQHPMITSSIKTGAKRVSKNTVGMNGRFPVGRAYILSDKDQFQWEKSELEAFAATTYTIDSASYNYYWSKSGQDLVEVTYLINNQGANEIPLKVPGTPTYLAINNQAHVLTKTKNDELLLNVPTGTNQQVLVQYKVENKQPRFIASNFSNLPKPDTSVSSASLTLQLPKEHRPLFFKNGDDWELYFNFTNLFRVAILFFMLTFFMRKMNFDKKVAASVAGCLSLISLYFASVFTWTILLVMASFVLAYRDRLSAKENFTPKKIIGGFAVLCMGVVIVVGLMSPRYSSYVERDYVPQAQMIGANIANFGGAPGSPRIMKKSAMKGYARAEAELADDVMEFSEEQVSVSSFDASEMDGDKDNYQGLPARIQIPSEGRRIHLNQGFTEAKRNLAFVAWSLNGWILKVFNYGLLIFCLVALWRNREKYLAFTKLNRATA